MRKSNPLDRIKAALEAAGYRLEAIEKHDSATGPWFRLKLRDDPRLTDELLNLSVHSHPVVLEFFERWMSKEALRLRLN